MATIILGAAASAAAGTTAFAGTAAAIGITSAAGIAAAGTALSTAAGIAGNLIDNQIFGGSKTNIVGSKLSNLSVQSSAYGNVIPQIYGTVRTSGNIIWSQDIKETAVTSSSSSGGKGGGGAAVSQTSYNYSVTLAIAICTGQIDEIVRVWADAKAINPNDYPNSYTMYKGTNTQLADPTIESFEGTGNVPAYRDLAYVVIEDFPLGDFGNRIPNFTFEIKKKDLPTDINNESAEEMITSMIMIPGSGEFVYDTTIQTKVPGEQVGSNFIQGDNKTKINLNNRNGKADSLVALDQMLETCPNLEWVGVVVTWFGDDLDAGLCTIRAGVEYDAGALTEPDLWQVDSDTRSTAYLISQDGNGNPIYGGTPSDISVTHYLDELKNRGLKIMFYPMFFMDTANKPWRGRVTGSTTDIATFFTKTDGYNEFINHYANLVKTKVDAFVIGSELIGLTSVKDSSDDSFPAIDELVNLAASVKTTVGSEVKVTYAADWSEYHHTTDGWYNLDPLWASSNIDFIGIDAYFPLTDEPQSGYNPQKIIDGWTSGEGFDWEYTDEARTIKANLAAEYAWKNIDWWWKNQHVNPDLTTTAWIPQSKKIWLTEYGFPSVDGAANQPNVFYDPNSSESSFPRFSKGRIDFLAQRQGIAGTETQWKNSAMIERLFVWTWDARPYPFWPDLKSVWTDGDLWKTGHWIQGKFGTSNLGAIVADICRKSGLTDVDFDVTELTDLVDGYILANQTTGRSAIEILQAAYFFDAVESDGIVKFVKRGGDTTLQLQEIDLIANGTDAAFTANRIQEIELPQKIDVTYLSKTFDYQVGNQHSQRLTGNSDELKTVNLPIVMTDQLAKNIADSALYNLWQERTEYSFGISQEYAYIEPSDIIEVTFGNIVHKIRIIETVFSNPGILSISGLAEDISIYDFYNKAGESGNSSEIIAAIPETRLEILDLPALPSDLENDSTIRFATTGLEADWKGSVIYRSDDAGISYSQIANIGNAAIIGSTTTGLASGIHNAFDDANNVTILLSNGELESVTEQAVLNGANIAIIGSPLMGYEIIQFKNATLVSQNKYILSGLLRGRLGTENAMANHIAGETFILLDSRIAKINAPINMAGLSRKYKAVSIGNTLGNTPEKDFTYNANSLKPLSPVHIIGNRDGSNNLTISWIRRTRIGGEWRDLVDIPLSEESEKYEVDIMNGSTVVRTISGLTSPSASYSAAEQTTDFGSTQSSITVDIYQISASVGRGTVGTEGL